MRCFVVARLLLYLPKSPRNGPVTFARQPGGIGPERNMPMTSVLLTVFEMSAAMAIGFVLGGFLLSRIWQIWQIRCDLEEQRDLISVLQRIEAKCGDAVGAIEKILN
jgi:hypothetical protein